MLIALTTLISLFDRITSRRVLKKESLPAGDMEWLTKDCQKYVRIPIRTEVVFQASSKSYPLSTDLEVLLIYKRVGQTWQYRKLCAEDGIHRALISGIHGSANSGGAVSIVMSGGYVTNS